VGRPVALIPVALASLALTACGGDDENNTATFPENPGPTPHDPGIGAEGGPSGALTAAGIGAVEVGATPDEVEAEFGEPIDTQGVDFGGGGGNAPQENWVYRFPKGDVTIKFDAKSGEFAGYDVYTSDLETDDGIKVGDPESLLRKRYGDDLAEGPIALGTLVLSESAPGTAESPALSFAIQGKQIFTISGGDVSQPAGE
jgi:hypothetical protein